MNTGDMDMAETYRQVYDAIVEIAHESFDEWTAMDAHTLLRRVMQKTGGHCNPTMIERIIQEL